MVTPVIIDNMDRYTVYVCVMNINVCAYLYVTIAMYIACTCTCMDAYQRLFIFFVLGLTPGEDFIITVIRDFTSYCVVT